MKEVNRDQLRLRNHIFGFKEEVNLIYLKFSKMLHNICRV